MLASLDYTIWQLCQECAIHLGCLLQTPHCQLDAEDKPSGDQQIPLLSSILFSTLVTVWASMWRTLVLNRSAKVMQTVFFITNSWWLDTRPNCHIYLAALTVWAVFPLKLMLAWEHWHQGLCHGWWHSCSQWKKFASLDSVVFGPWGIQQKNPNCIGPLEDVLLLHLYGDPRNGQCWTLLMVSVLMIQASSKLIAVQSFIFRHFFLTATFLDCLLECRALSPFVCIHEKVSLHWIVLACLYVFIYASTTASVSVTIHKQRPLYL